MLTIRFNRIGKKNKAFFRLVVQEHTIAPGGGHVEILGSYDPHLKKDSLKRERIKYWVAKGVKFSDTAFNFLVSKGLIQGAKRKVKLPKKPARNAEQGMAGGAETLAPEEKPAQPKAEGGKIEASIEASKEEPKKESKPEGEEAKPEAKKEEIQAKVDKKKETA